MKKHGKPTLFPRPLNPNEKELNKRIDALAEQVKQLVQQINDKNHPDLTEESDPGGSWDVGDFVSFKLKNGAFVNARIVRLNPGGKTCKVKCYGGKFDGIVRHEIPYKNLLPTDVLPEDDENDDDDTDSDETDPVDRWIIVCDDWLDQPDEQIIKKYFVGLIDYHGGVSPNRGDYGRSHWTMRLTGATAFMSKTNAVEVIAKHRLTTAFYAGQGQCFTPEVVRVKCAYNPDTGVHDRISEVPKKMLKD